jgi:hypothetical protein
MAVTNTSTFYATAPNAIYYDENGNKLTILSKAVNYPTVTVGDQATPVVAAVAGKKIRVLAMALSTSINGPSCYLRSGAGGTQISETILRNISGSTAAVNYQRSAYYPIFLYETAAGQALVLNCTNTGVASVQVVYVLV